MMLPKASMAASITTRSVLFACSQQAHKSALHKCNLVEKGYSVDRKFPFKVQIAPLHGENAAWLRDKLDHELPFC